MSFAVKSYALLLLSLYMYDVAQVNSLRLRYAISRMGLASSKSSRVISDSRLFLELSDILNDESSEFLDALRRQMDGTVVVNANPREISNRIKSFFTIVSKRSPEEILHFKKVCI